MRGGRGVKRRTVGIKERMVVVGRAGSLNNSVFCQVAELHVAEGFPWAHHCDVCAETLHAGDVVTEPGRRTERQCLTAASSHSFARLSIYTKIFF